jgi:hypothetical protein
MGFFSKTTSKKTPPHAPTCTNPSCKKHGQPMTRFDEPCGMYRYACTAPYCGYSILYKNGKEVRQ